jgi:hypothetical protein
LGQGRVGVVVQFEVDGDDAEVLGALGFDEVDSIGAGDGAFERCRYETADEVGIRADVAGFDVNDGDVALGVLPYVEGADGLDACEEDEQVDDDREDGATDEEVGEGHE